MRVFLDTNVLVSAFATRGLCADLLELVLLQHELIVSRSLLRELERALRLKVKLPARDAAAIGDFLSDEAAQLLESSPPAAAAVDADDAVVLGDAAGAQAEVFVTGDAKVLALGRHAGFRIVSPRAFWDMLQGERSR